MAKKGTPNSKRGPKGGGMKGGKGSKGGKGC